MVLPFYILINAEKGQGDYIAQEANKIKGVKMAHHVTGSVDVILYAEADDFSDHYSFQLPILSALALFFNNKKFRIYNKNLT